ncbi:hypothetical protein RhiirA1_458669 [Rhizophagus irregularis]|uniref:RNase H type-1 domain-containing protein n=1 Tax=Rhizophagus irregularis TaxID=588596 RepID=A0A2N0RV99_9GLOM|nr:hypothetical protein RhiirA1_458669 [Rhizophagus irregularis]
MNWFDLRYLDIIGRKGRIPTWFNFIKNNFLSSSSLFLPLYFINSSFTLASPCLLDHTVKDYQFYPQWAINFDFDTQTLSVGCVCITYKKQNSAIMSHWLPVSTSADERSYNPCPGCALNIPALSKKSAIKQRCNSEKCFFNVTLSETVGYPTRNAKVFAAYLPITLSTSWSYATSLALAHLMNPPLTVSFTLSPSVKDSLEDDVLPSSVQSLYTDGSFRPAKDSLSSSMASAWIALDDDGFILESSSMHLPSCFPSALRSEIYAVLLGLNALSRDSSISVYTDCSQLISLWTRFVDVPFSPKLLCEPNHLLWFSIRQLIMDRNLQVDLIKVPAHGDDVYNVQADSLAKDAHSSLQPSVSPLAFCHAPCLLAFNFLPIDMNIRHFLRSIADARALLSFCSLARFTALGSPSLFDWAVFATYLPITLSTSWSYASSLALMHLTNLSFSDPPDTSSPSTSRINDDDVLPLSVHIMYTDGSFLSVKDSSPPSMTSAWLALDDDEFILESSSLCLPSCFPSALRSEIYAVVLGLNALSHNSSISIYTDCSQLISLWKHFVNAPFSPKLFHESNHLLWLSIRHLIMERNLNVDLIKVPAHGDDIYNIQADSLAKNAHSSL